MKRRRRNIKISKRKYKIKRKNMNNCYKKERNKMRNSCKLKKTMKMYNKRLNH